MKGPIAIYLNPHARKNRRAAQDRHRRLQARVGTSGRVWETATLAQLASAIGEAVALGARAHVADGGDGTLNWVIHELRRALHKRGEDPDRLPPVVPASSGTVDVVADRAGIRGRTEDLLDDVLRWDGDGDPIVHFDTLRLQGQQRTASGPAPFDRLGFALAAGGVGQRFFARYDDEGASGPVAILTVVAKAMLSYAAASLALPAGPLLDDTRSIFEPTRARVTIDGVELPTRRHGAIHAGAIDVNLAGVFTVFPLARDRGCLHFQAGAISPWEMMAALPRLVRGRLLKVPTLEEVCGRLMTIEAEGGELLAPIIDGERFHDIASLTVSAGPPVPILAVQRTR